MRAVVTGGAGFIGSHLIEVLLAGGHDVVCVERLGAPRGWSQGLSVDFRPIGLEDAPALQRAIDGSDVVFHLAGLTAARRVADFYAVNTEGTARVLQAAAAQPGAAPRVVLLSSIAALGPCRNGDLLSTRTVPYPLSHYGHSKLLAESLVHAYADRVPTTILRFCSVYGPRERAVLMLFQLVRRGFALTVGPWAREVSLLYVKDAVAALLGAGTSPAAVNRTYCVAHPTPVSWRTFAEAVGRAVGRRPTLLCLPAMVGRSVALAAEAIAKLRNRAAILSRERLREMIQQRWVCDVVPALRDLSFRPAYALDRGVAETAAWYREAGWL